LTSAAAKHFPEGAWRYTLHPGFFVDFVGDVRLELGAVLDFLSGVFSGIAAPSEPFLRLRGNTLPRVVASELRTLSNGWVFCFPGGAVDAYTSDGLARLEADRASITVTPVASARYHLAGAFGAGFSYALGARGGFFLHAAAFSLDDICAVVVADSGAGKSTLSAGVLAASGRLISDDMVIVAPDTAGSHRIYAGRRDAYLSSAALGMLPRRYADAMPPKGLARRGKLPMARSLAPDAFLTDATPTHLLILDREHPRSAVSIEPVSQAEALAAIVAASVRLARSALTESYPSTQTALQLACALPAYRLRCPNSLLSRPAEVVNRLLRQLESGS
jgi:hypothetical protein